MMEKENRFKYRIKIIVVYDDGNISMNEHYPDQLTQDIFDDAIDFLKKEKNKFPIDYSPKQKWEI